MLDALTAEYRRRCVEGVDWVVRRWWQRLRPDPLRRLGLSADDEAHVRALTRPDARAATPAQRERVELAVREVTEASAKGLPDTWARSVHDATVASSDELSDAIDDAVDAVDVSLDPPAWWHPLAILQTVLVGLSVVGLVWWLSTFAGAPSPRLGSLSVPLLLLLDGIGLSAVVALGGRWLALLGAQRRRARVAAQLRTSISAVAIERVVAPIAAVLIDHRSTRQALEGAR
jgi:hypothetical protein